MVTHTIHIVLLLAYKYSKIIRVEEIHNQGGNQMKTPMATVLEKIGYSTFKSKLDKEEYKFVKRVLIPDGMVFEIRAGKGYKTILETSFEAREIMGWKE
jgi:hypothetical protein